MPVPGRTLMHMVFCAIGVGSARTQTTERERAALRNHSKDKERGVEIGVFEGVTTCVLASQMREEGVLFAVDPFVAGRAGVNWTKITARQQVKRHGLQHKVRFVERYSFEACEMISGDFDFIFIDGDHSLGGIERDWSDWSGRVVADGIVALHDTRVPSHNPGVASLGSYHYFEKVIKHDDRFELIEQVDSLSVLRRKAY